MKQGSFSCEFFPPKTMGGVNGLYKVINEYEALQPTYFSITFGAGGGIVDSTSQLVSSLNEKFNTPIVPHISCLADSKENILDLLQQYKNQGVNKLVVLRGDVIPGVQQAKPIWKYASNLVSFIREHTGDYFAIDVAAYPECHPESNSLYSDVETLKIKQDEGANRAITQYFYNIDSFFHYRDLCHKLGVSLPIIPGIMPILNFSNLKRFSLRCEAELPRWLVKQMCHFTDELSQYNLGLDIVTRLCEQLLAEGVDELHFYTLNGFKAVNTILQRLGLSVADVSTTNN